MSHDTQVRKRLAFEQIHLDTNKRPINHYSFVGGISSGKGKKFGQPTKRGGNFGRVTRGGRKFTDLTNHYKMLQVAEDSTLSQGYTYGFSAPFLFHQVTRAINDRMGATAAQQ